VIVTAHKCEGVILRALQGVAEAIAFLRADRRLAAQIDQEVILVDDGSTDNTHRQGLEFARGNPYCKVIHREKSNSPSCARNLGASQAQGDLLCSWTATRCFNLDPTRGHEQAGTRPGLVVSADQFNQTPLGLAVAVPITSRAKEYPLYIRIDPPEGALEQPSFAKCEDLRSVSRKRLSRPLGRVRHAVLRQAEDRLRARRRLPERLRQEFAKLKLKLELGSDPPLPPTSNRRDLAPASRDLAEAGALKQFTS
jgi:mRNA interferase MazF